jgi:hypothetical protein
LGTKKLAAIEAYEELITTSGTAYSAGRTAVRDAAPKAMRLGSNKVQEALMNEAEDDMELFVHSKITGKEERQPTPQEYKQEALRLMLRVHGDPANTGWVGLVPEEGEKAFTKFGLEAETLSAKQKAVARVPIATIPPSFMRSMREDMDEIRVRNGLPTIVDPDTDLLEKIAGAMAMGDKRRLRVLLNLP